MFGQYALAYDRICVYAFFLGVVIGIPLSLMLPAVLVVDMVISGLALALIAYVMTGVILIAQYRWDAVPMLSWIRDCAIIGMLLGFCTLGFTDIKTWVLVIHHTLTGGLIGAMCAGSQRALFELIKKVNEL